MKPTIRIFVNDSLAGSLAKRAREVFIFEVRKREGRAAP